MCCPSTVGSSLQTQLTLRDSENASTCPPRSPMVGKAGAQTLPCLLGLSAGSPPPSLCHHEKAQTTSPLSVLTVIPKCPKMSTFCPISYHSLATPSRIPYLCPLNSGSSRNCPIASRLLGSPSLCLVLTPTSPLRALPPWVLAMFPKAVIC